MARKARPPEEKASDVALGERLARLRKDRGFTQVELAEKLGIIQTIVSDYERGRLRPHHDMIVRMAKVLDVSTDELLGVVPPAKRPGAQRNLRFVRRLQMIEKLPRRDQDALLRTIDAFLDRAKTG